MSTKLSFFMCYCRFSSHSSTRGVLPFLGLYISFSSFVRSFVPAADTTVALIAYICSVRRAVWCGLSILLCVFIEQYMDSITYVLPASVGNMDGTHVWRIAAYTWCCPQIVVGSRCAVNTRRTHSLDAVTVDRFFFFSSLLSSSSRSCQC